VTQLDSQQKRNAKQIAAFQSQVRFNNILAGRRSGKTFVMRERCIKKLAHSPKSAEVYYIGPTNAHAKELAWDYFYTRMQQLRWIVKPLISRQVFLLPDNRKLYVIGAEKIDRIRGHSVWHAALDELAYFKQPMSAVWTAVRPTLTDMKGTADFGTTPNGKGSDAYDWYMSKKGRFGWSYHHWYSLDNPWLDPAEIEEAKKELDEKAFRQEYEAGWETYEGLAYYNFDEAAHIRPCGEIDQRYPLHLCFDFNVNPTTLIVSQYDPILRRMYYRKEYSFADSSTERTISAFIGDYRGKLRDTVRIRGDAAGNARKSTTGKSDYYYIFESLKSAGIDYKFEVPPANPPIIDRVNTVNGWLKPMVGETRVMIDPSCRMLLKDLSGQKLEGRLPSPNNNLGHKADAMGYDIYYQNLIEKRPISTVTRY
jgi:hypothetical protein